MEESGAKMEVCDETSDKVSGEGPTISCDKASNKSDESLNKVADKVPNNISVEVPEKASDEVPEKDADEVPNKKVPEKASDEVLNKKASDEVPEKASDEVPEKASGEVPEKASDEVPSKASDEVLEEASNKVSEEVADKAAEENASEVTEKAPSYNYVLVEEIVKTLKCSLCHQYLSYPPVYIISEADSKYKCGRCTIHTRFNIRAVMYENLAKFMKFPCIYKDCPEKLSWGDVREHERACEFRTVLCIAPDCHEHILYNKFAEHFKEKHIKFFHTNTLTKENVHTKYGMALLEKDDRCYMVLYDNDQDKFRISVCSLGAPDKQFELVFNSKEKPQSIVVSQQNIVPFNERAHCYKCLMGECKSEYHIYRYHRKGVLKHAHTKVDRELVKRTFGGSNIASTVSVVDEKVETEDELDELLMGKDVIIDEVNDEEEAEKVVKEEQKSALSGMLKCPGCDEQMAPPIFECLAGHTVCGGCKAKSEDCAECEARVENTRNYILEEVVANLKLAEQEKTEKVESTDVEILCPMSKCFEKIKLQSISNHFKENHITNFHFNTLIIKDVYGYYNVDVLVKDNRTYVVFFDFDDCSFGISVCSIEPDQHRYEVKLHSDNNKFAVISTNQKIIPFNEKEHCAKCSIGVCKIADHTYRQKRKAIFRRLTTKMTRDCMRRTFRSNKMDFKITVLEARDSHADKILRQLFECPICKDYMAPPIHQCVAGHTLCHVCKTKLEKCPSCEGRIDATRNHFLEKMAEKVELPCVYEPESCVFRGGIKRIATHELECPLKTKKACREVKKEARAD